MMRKPSRRHGPSTLAALLFFAVLPPPTVAETLPFRFDFGPGPAAPGFTRVTAADSYTGERGYGFDLGTSPECLDRGGSDALRRDLCTGDRPFFFSVAVPEGNYRVTLTLGDPAGASATTVKAESRRLMLEKVETRDGQLDTRTFTVNVRGPVIAGGGEVRLKDRERGALHWDDKLTLEFGNARPAVAALEIRRVEDAVTVFLAGDSTVTDQIQEPYAAWGQMLPRFFKPGVAIANHAESGETLNAFVAENRLAKVTSQIQAGDYLFIQFGHNDQKPGANHVEPFTTYKDLLRQFMTQARSRGATPVLVTSMLRRSFDDAGRVVNTLGDYPEALRQLAKEEQATLIDLHAASRALYEALGPEGSKRAFLHYAAGAFLGQERQLRDNSHFSAYGAYELAKAVVEGIRSGEPRLASYFVDDLPRFDPAHPDPVHGWSLPVSPPLPETPARGEVFFSPKDMMSVGVYYYPEAWPREQWARDLANIRKHGFEFVHMAEFAWAFMEPDDGRFDFEWLETNVRLAAEQGLKVVLCTPSATPPAWLARKHPEILMVDANGRRMNHGAREHATWSSPGYRRYVERVVTELGRRFGDNPAVWGWQIDNELSHYGKGYSYGEADQERFRDWLRTRYGDIHRLNEAWGNAFWSQMYNDFGQIDIPNPEELVAGVNEHALLDFQRFFAEEAADYIRFQARLLRQHTRGQWVTTNFMALHEAVYPPLSGDDLDIVTWTTYPVHGELLQGPLGFRLGDGTAFSFMSDFARSINGRHGLMELQPGQVNWGVVNPQPYPGAVRNWILRAFALGADLLCTYRYRQPLFGNEQLHSGIVGTDGVTLSRGGEEWVQAMREIRRLRENRPADPKQPPRYAARRSAILYHVDNRFDLDNHPQTTRWDTMGHLLKYQRALKGAGAPVDVITEDKDFMRYRVLIAPAYQLVDAALVARWRTYVEGGGHLILSTRTGLKDRHGHLFEGPWAAPILELIGAGIRLYDVLPAPHTGHVKSSLSGRSHEWGTWAEAIQPGEGTDVLARHEDQFYSGAAAAVSRRLGEGTVTYVGVETVSGDLEREIVRKVFDDAGVAVEDLPDSLFLDWRDGFWVASNFSSTRQSAPLPPGVTPLVGARELEPAGVAIWRE
jgi:beta-galactosidase